MLTLSLCVRAGQTGASQTATVCLALNTSAALPWRIWYENAELEPPSQNPDSLLTLSGLRSYTSSLSLSPFPPPFPQPSPARAILPPA